MGARAPVSACAWIPFTPPPGSKSFDRIAQDRMPPFMQVFFPTAERERDPRPQKSRKGGWRPIAMGPGQSRKPCARAVPCACAGEAPRQKNAGQKTCKGAPGLYMRQRCRIGAAHGLTQTLAETALNCGSFCVCFLAGSYARAGARRSARLGVCARVFLAPPPGQESFGLHCGIPRAPSYARKIPASGFQQGAPQEARSSSAALPVPCGIRPALTASGGATVRPGGP